MEVEKILIKDITKKKLEEHEDVFADIFNALVFKGKEVIKPEDLTLLPTPEELKEDAPNYISNYNMNLVSMAELSPDVREHFSNQISA